MGAFSTFVICMWKEQVCSVFHLLRSLDWIWLSSKTLTKGGGEVWQGRCPFPAIIP